MVFSSHQAKIQHLHKKNSSVTLIEQLVAIALLGLLTSLIVITLNRAEMLRRSFATSNVSLNSARIGKAAVDKLNER